MTTYSSTLLYKKNETELFLYEMVNYEQIFKRPVILREMSEGGSSVPTFSFEQNISSKKQKIWSFDGIERTNHIALEKELPFDYENNQA